MGWDFLNKMGRKRHASEYLADSGSVSSASTSKMPSGSARVVARGGSGGGAGIAGAESVEGWPLLRLIQSTAALPLPDAVFSSYLDARARARAPRLGWKL